MPFDALDALTDADVSGAVVSAMEDLRAGARVDGGRGLRGEVFDEDDEERRSAELDLLCILLAAEGVDIFDAPMRAYIRIDQAVDLITEAAAEVLFAPVVAAAISNQ